MKIGRDRTPLSERLSEQVESQADQAADLMQSALKSFESDCRASLNAAQHTIESDITLLLHQSARMSRSVKPILLTASLLALTVILLSLIASWILASKMIDKAQTASLWQLGLTINQTNNGKVLTWDANKLRQTDCRSGSEPVPCLKIIERK